MKQSIIAPPEGTRDIIFEECTASRRQNARMEELFTRRGYREVSTPVLEYYDLFCRTGSPIPEQSMFKVIDRSGRICVLRPDSTTPIARLAATRLGSEPLPLRLWYAQPVFRSENAHNGAPAQLMQTGVELIGLSGRDADADLLHLSAECLRQTGGQIRIELSHAGIFLSLCDALSLSAGERETLRALILRKNFGMLGDALERYGNHPAAKDLSLLMRLSGGKKALADAKACQTPALYPALQELSELWELLPEDIFSVDFGMVQSIEYYTGVVFRGYAAGAAAEILIGGRYDNLLGLLGRDAPAIGFAVNMDALPRSYCSPN